jgi:hypothetical protein
MQLRSGGGWNHLMSKLILKPDSTGGENKNKNICKILWTILQYEIIFCFLFDSKNLKFEIMTIN